MKKKLNLEKDFEADLISKKHSLKFYLSLIFFIFTFGAFIIILYFNLFLTLPPEDFPLSRVFEVKQGDTVSDIAHKLKDSNYIQSEFLFKLAQKKFPNTNMKAGKYIFDKKMSVWEIYQKIAKGEGDLSDKQVKLTIRPGEPNYVLAKRFSRKMKNIEEDDFIIEAKAYEGELATETINFNLDDDAKTVVKRFRDEFENQLKKNKIKIPEDKRKEILTIASLVEAEAGAGSYQDKRHVAGIIYNRLRKKMPLQLDATFLYIKKIGPKDRRVIYKSDFNLESKYNTYKYSGLPPSPISNPSIASIKAALNPMKTKDLYYITDKNGVFHYTSNGKEHIKNVNNYLR